MLTKIQRKYCPLPNKRITFSEKSVSDVVKLQQLFKKELLTIVKHPIVGLTRTLFALIYAALKSGVE